MTTQRVLFVGLSEHERSWLKSWFTTRGHRAWFASHALAALRVFDEVEPTTVVIDTLAAGSDAVRLASVLQAAAPGCPVVFLGNHALEAAYFGEGAGLENARFAYRPIDPEVLLGTPSETDRFVGELDDRGEVNGLGLARLLFTMLETRSSGTLYLGDGPSRRVIHFRDGQATRVESHIPSENFGRLLVEWGAATRVEIDWAQSLQLSEGIRQGEALVKIGVLDDARVSALLQRQYETKLTRAFSATPVAYRLDAGAAGAGRGDALNVLQAAIEGLQRCGAAGPQAWAELSTTPFRILASLPEAVRDTVDEVIPASLRTRCSRAATLEELSRHGFEPEWLVAVYLCLKAAGYAVEAAPESNEDAA